MKLSAQARSRKRLADERQLSLDFRAQVSFRKAVIAALEKADQFQTAQQVVAATGLKYKQVIDVLDVLYRLDLITREGRKFTAKWGCKKLEKPSGYGDFSELESIFRGFFTK